MGHKFGNEEKKSVYESKASHISGPSDYNIGGTLVKKSFNKRF